MEMRVLYSTAGSSIDDTDIRVRTRLGQYRRRKIGADRPAILTAITG